jgi:hypothetical protein
MQGPQRRKNCHQDIFQCTEETAIAWVKLRAVRRMINRVPLKFQNSLLGFRGSMRSGIFYAVSNPLLSRPSRFLRTESASVCRTVQYVSLKISTGFWKWWSSTPWKSQKSQHYLSRWWHNFKHFGYKWTGMLPLPGCMFLFGLEMKDPWLICWVCFRP